MNLAEYSVLDGVALAALVKQGEVTASELAVLAWQAMDAVNPEINAVVEVYDERIEKPHCSEGPFEGVPFLVKDSGTFEAGYKRELGSRLCEGVKLESTAHVIERMHSAGLNIIGRTNVPEFCIAGTTENALYGNTSTPWAKGYSSGGSSGGAAAAVAAGIVPMAHGSDIGGSIRIPASLCGGVGLKPSRGRVSAGPLVDEGGQGMATNFVQTRSVRDTAAMLDCLGGPMPGDPFIIQQPLRPYSQEVGAPLEKLRVAFCAEPIGPGPVDASVADAVRKVADLLEDMGHEVTEAAPSYDYESMTKAFLDTWFFGFYRVIDGHAEMTGRAVGPDTLEHQTRLIYEASKSMNPYDFLEAQGIFNNFRRGLGSFFESYDIWLTPSTAKISEPFGLYHQGRDDVDAYAYLDRIDRPVQFATPYNISGCPAMSLPLAMSPEGLPIGIQIGTRFGGEDRLLRLAGMLERALPWADRLPPLHAMTCGGAGS